MCSPPPVVGVHHCLSGVSTSMTQVRSLPLAGYSHLDFTGTFTPTCRVFSPLFHRYVHPHLSVLRREDTAIFAKDKVFWSLFSHVCLHFLLWRDFLPLSGEATVGNSPNGCRSGAFGGNFLSVGSISVPKVLFVGGIFVSSHHLYI